jgi:hypothetical protein
MRSENQIRRARLLVSALTVAFTIPAATAGAQAPTFARVDHASLGNKHVVADFNGDGRADLAGQGPQAAAVMLGNGNGTFQARVLYPVADWTQDLAAGDFDRDGHLDLAVTVNNPQIGLALLVGNGDGTFQPAVHFPNTAGFDSPAIAAADLDADGNLDLVIGHEIACYTAPCTVARTLTVMLGNGDGTFQPATEIDIGTTTADIAVADFNRDGTLDLAIASNSSRVIVLLGVGNGTFLQQPTMTMTPDTFAVDATDVDVADVNGDTLPDLVVAVATNGSRTAVVRGNGDGTFQLPPLILTDPNLSVPQYQAVADYNGDGALDLALCVANGTWGLMQIRNGNGSGGFGPPVMHQVPPPLSSIGCIGLVASDLNGDNKPDVTLSIGGASTGLAALRNTTGQTPPPVPGTPSLIAPSDGATVVQPVTLDWTNVASAATYEVQVDNSSTISAPFVANPTVTASQVTLGGLPGNTTLWWRVRARNSAGVAGPFSSVRRFRPQGTPAPATLSAVSMNPSSVVGGNGSTGTVTLSSGAPSGGAVVALSSNNSAVASVPGSVTVPAGATTATFAATTAAVTTSTPVTVSAAYNGVNRTATLTVNPPGQTATLTVTATGRAGERVLSTPAGISVLVGTTGSAPFNTGTAITLRVTNERDAFWSGACSSGGSKTKTCTFTLNGNASVSANVQ